VSALPRLAFKPGIPPAPGRGKLLRFARPLSVEDIARQAREEQRHAEHERVCLGPPPRPLWGYVVLAWGALTLAVMLGIAAGVGLTTTALREAQASEAEARETAEVLSAHSDHVACRLLGAHAIIHEVPGLEPHLLEWHGADLHPLQAEAQEQLGDTLAARCEGRR